MIANAANDSSTLKIDAMSGIQKAAVLLVMLGDSTSAELIKQLSEDDIQLVSREIARLNAISTEQAESVLNEFYQMTTARNYVVRGGIDYAKNMLVNAFGPEAAQRLMDRLSKALGHDMANFDALQKADPQQLAKFLQAERPQTIALVLSHLNPSQAAALLAALPQEQRGDIALRVAHLDQISPDVINKIATVIGQKLDALGDYSRQSYGGVRAVAEMFNRLDSDTSKKVLADIEAQDPSLVETIRHMMFVFDDLLLLDDNAIKAILARVDRKVPMVALKGTTERLKNHFLQTMSERGAQMMREDIEALGPIKVKDVEVAQQEIIAVLRLLESEGVVSLRGAVGEQYVV
jgi:flagellar motor switch protein FliG